MSKKLPTAEDIERGKRIQYLRVHVLNDMPQETFAKQIGGVERGSVSNWERGGGITVENMAKIARRFRIPFEWISMGHGEPPVAGDVTPGRTHFDDTEILEDHVQPDPAFFRGNYAPSVKGALPELDVKLGAGQGVVGEVLTLPIGDSTYSGHRILGEWLLTEQFLTGEARASANNTIVLAITGDSMFPSYNYGDRVLVDLSQNQFSQDGVYAFSDGLTAPQIKRLHHVFRSNPRRVRIISDNPVYEKEEHLLSDIQIIGRVVGVIARR